MTSRIGISGRATTPLRQWGFLKCLHFSWTIVRAITLSQIHHMEVAQGAIFIEQNMRFGLDLGRFAILKKNWGTIMSNF